MIAIAVSVFSGAFLLFQVQPLIVRFILPWYGGGPGVWSTAMVFFQVMLVGGYAYAHAIRRGLSARMQAGLHVGLLALALATLPIVPAERFKSIAPDNPGVGILLLLFVTVGLPFFLLASTSPLLQSWAISTKRTNTPYRLYALSNIGSLLALLSYPFVFEPWFGRQTQAVIWSMSFVVFAASTTWVAAELWRTGGSAKFEGRRTREPRSTSPRPLTRLLWIGLPTAASILLLAVTNEISQDVAVIPFLWIVPLSLYLLTFVIAFDKDTWYKRGLFLPVLIPAIAAMVWMMFRAGTAPVGLQLGLLSLGLFICCMVCHGELARLKPAPTRLTEYYLLVAIGGALGGIFVGIIAPILFTSFLELHIGIALCVCLVLVVLLRDPRSPLRRGRPIWAWVVIATVYIGLSYALTRHVALLSNSAVAQTRNFYGVLTVIRKGEGTSDEALTLRNGMIDHGVQFTASEKSRLPVTYYSPESGIGRALRLFPVQSGRRIGLVGLGIGTVAAYTRRGDTLRVYEINPQVTELARTWFTYLDESPGEIQVVHGDARQSLEREPAQQFDILVLDAFSGDAIPIHLLTEQAFDLYRRHLVTDGVLVVHLSNRHLDLERVVRQHGVHLNLQTVMIRNSPGPNLTWRADWMLLTNNKEFLEKNGLVEQTTREGVGRALRPWTDDYSNLLAVLRSPW